MPRSKIAQGLCQRCADLGLDGFLQEDKVAHIVYCQNCLWRMDMDDFKDELDNASDDYEVHNVDDALKYLNNL